LNKETIIEAMGWYGAVAIIIAYLLVSFGFIAPDGATYQLLNFSGAIGIIIVSYIKKVMQPVVLNIFWALIAFVALIKILMG
jgi:hypothetical protein